MSNFWKLNYTFMAMKGPKVVMIGGGTGSFTLLSVLKDYVQDITALVNMADDGGSTGILRDELGVLPPGDVRQCLVALSRSSDQMRELFNYRFPEGTFEGHSFGNLFLTAVEKMTDNFSESVEFASDVLDIQGRVLPMTLDDIRLEIEFYDGSREKGELKIGHMDFQGKLRPKLHLNPAGKINPEANEAIKEADLVVIAPGNLYGSIGPALIIDGVATALNSSNAKLVYICNLMTNSGQTDGFKVSDYANEIERFIGKGRLDYVLYNNKQPSKELLEKYSNKRDYLVEWNDKALNSSSYQAIGGDYLSANIYTKDANDKLRKGSTLVRHDAQAVSEQLMKIYAS